MHTTQLSMCMARVREDAVYSWNYLAQEEGCMAQISEV